MGARLLPVALWALFAAVPARAALLRVTVFDQAGKPVEQAVVFGYDPGPVLRSALRQPFVMDQIDKVFVPHLLVVPVGASVKFPNRDDIHHSIYSFSPAKTFELPLYQGTPANPITFDKPGAVRLGCNIHDWMSGIVLVVPNSIHALTGPDGKAKLGGIPVTRALRLAVFHERLEGSVDETLQSVRGRKGVISEVTFQIKLKPPSGKPEKGR